MAIIQVTTGEETLKQAVAKVYVFHSPTDKQGKEMALSALAKDADSSDIIRRVGNPTFRGAVIGIKPEIGGQWITTNYEIRDGEVVKIFASKKTTWKGLLTTGCLFLRIRHDAALNKIKIKLLNMPGTKLKTADITGRFDVLTLEQARDFGAVVDARFEGYFGEGVTKKLFEVEVLERATAAPEVVQTRVLPAVDNQPAIMVRRRKQRRSLELNG